MIVNFEGHQVTYIPYTDDSHGPTYASPLVCLPLCVAWIAGYADYTGTILYKI